MQILGYFFRKDMVITPAKAWKPPEHCWSEAQQGHGTPCMASAGNSFLRQCQDGRAKTKTVMTDVTLFDLFLWGNVARRESNLNRSKRGVPLVCDNP